MDFEQYKRAFDEVNRDFEKSVAQFGLPFETDETEPRSRRIATARATGCQCENADTSLWRGWISPACLACRTGERTATFFIDLRCTRHCYFCFNPNQDNYEYFLTHTRDIAGELRQAHAQGAQFDCLAVTGGEPLLHKLELLEFLQVAREFYLDAHLRLYTCGDLLDDETLAQLAAAGLDEVRFSVKPDDDSTAREAVFDAMRRAVGVIPSVMIELPVIPGTRDFMEDLLIRADDIGVRGVNLLEFCFPLCNADEFAKRGFKLRKRPYTYLYNYWYGGGIPVAGSESEALQLLAFAHERGLGLGIHYCSSDNKNTGQIFQQNLAWQQVPAVHDAYLWLEEDPESRFLVCAKAFGDDVPAVCAWARQHGVDFNEDAATPSIAIPLSCKADAQKACPHTRFGTSVNVFERRDDGTLYLHEVALE